MKSHAAFPVRTAIVLAVTNLVALGCSEQAEGERCDVKSGSSDCESGLICVSHDQLVRGRDDNTDRCCPPDDQTPSDDRCRRAVAPVLSSMGNGAASGDGTGGRSTITGEGPGVGGDGGQPAAAPSTAGSDASSAGAATTASPTGAAAGSHPGGAGGGGVAGGGSTSGAAGG